MLAAFGMPGCFELLVVSSSIFVTVLPFWMICTKSDFPGRYNLALLIPVLNIVFLTFAASPIFRKPEHGWWTEKL